MNSIKQIEKYERNQLKRVKIDIKENLRQYWRGGSCIVPQREEERRYSAYIPACELARKSLRACVSIYKAGGYGWKWDLDMLKERITELESANDRLHAEVVRKIYDELADGHSDEFEGEACPDR